MVDFDIDFPQFRIFSTSFAPRRMASSAPSTSILMWVGISFVFLEYVSSVNDSIW